MDFSESQKSKMLSSKPYHAMDEELVKERQHAQLLTYRYNATRPDETSQRKALLQQLLGNIAEGFHLEPPFRCDYGYNIRIGKNFFANYNLVILDCAAVEIGDHVLIGPNVGIYTAGHPVHFETRNQGYEYALPIKLGHHVWIGGHVVINPGVTIGDYTVIGSGSVVTRDIPPRVVAAGNPCRILRPISEADRAYFYPNQRF